MNRRGILKAIMGAPIAAPAMAKEAAAGLAAGQLALGAPSSPPSSPLQDAFNAARDRAFREHHAKQSPLPHHIANKRSWSDAFKMHVAMQDQRELDSIWGSHFNRMTPEHMTRVLKAIGALE